MTPSDQTRLETQLQRLQLRHFKSHYQAAADKAAEQQRSHVDYLAQLADGETALRENRSIERRVRNARFPVLKTIEDFQWSWPRKINRPQIQNLFRLAFIASHTNVVLIGNVGLGKTHLSIALGQAACLNGHTVLFTTAIDIVNTLAAAQAALGQFPEAVRTAEKALEHASAGADTALAHALRDRLRRYQQGQPFATPDN
jgi:DNA replication protein DnaC